LGDGKKPALLIRGGSALIQKAYQGPGKTKEGGYILSPGIPQGTAKKGKIRPVNKPVGVYKVERGGEGRGFCMRGL
jgi:hypothetical protein